MLRPTQSAIVFTQLLGRGLRKSKGKDFVVIIDFIANYQRNYMIPIALSGDNSYDKDNLRRFTAEGSKLIAGTSTVNFDAISKDRIYRTIDSAKLSDRSLIYNEYDTLKYKLGHIPSLLDFDIYNAIDPLKIIKVFGSYYAFLRLHERSNYHIVLSKAEEDIISYVSQKIATGKRISELLMLKAAIDDHSPNLALSCKESAKKEYNITLDDNTLASTIGFLTNAFSKINDKEKYSNCIFLEKSTDGYQASKNFKAMLDRNKDFKLMLEELIKLGVQRYNAHYRERYESTNFTLYEKYSYEDVCHLLNWKQNQIAQGISGYFYDRDT